ncbi:MAG: signal peptide peptidase SppA [Cellulosilyticum sp.]|nr:signal peptide peptidase SppA [Cellulosilyticum sp.]
MKPGLVALCVICGMIMFLGFWYILFSQFFGNLFSAVSGMDSNAYMESGVYGDTIDVFYVEGTIAEGSTTYQHTWTLNQIDHLMESESNKGIILYVNSPGGGIYESDELYLKIKEYKETTGRPVYAYMAQTAASGGLYVSMAADEIYANRMTMTGSIGVIMSTTDTTGLQELIGIKEENITSGPNKAMGNPLTDEQRAILQSMVDESYDIFVEIIAENRNLDDNKVREIADGRIYSARQAKELGLIDEIASYEETVQNFIDTYKLEDCTIYHQRPPLSALEELLLSVETDLESSKVTESFTAIHNYIEANKSPKIMYYMGH